MGCQYAEFKVIYPTDMQQDSGKCWEMITNGIHLDLGTVYSLP